LSSGRGQVRTRDAVLHRALHWQLSSAARAPRPDHRGRPRPAHPRLAGRARPSRTDAVDCRPSRPPGRTPQSAQSPGPDGVSCAPRDPREPRLPRIGPPSFSAFLAAPPPGRGRQ
jgi:hypothetical protein